MDDISDYFNIHLEEIDLWNAQISADSKGGWDNDDQINTIPALIVMEIYVSYIKSFDDIK